MVLLKGNIPYEKMSSVYKSADIFVLPSLRESGGNVLIEAMAHKLPIVSPDMSISKILNEKQTGIFVNTDQFRCNIITEFAILLEYLLKNYERRKYYGENGYQFVNQELGTHD